MEMIINKLYRVLFGGQMTSDENCTKKQNYNFWSKIAHTF